MQITQPPASHHAVPMQDVASPADPSQPHVGAQREALRQLIVQGNEHSIRDFFSQNHSSELLDALAQDTLAYAIEMKLMGGSERIDLVRALLDGLPSTALNAKDAAGVTPLMLAASKGHRDIVELLMDKGATIDEADNKGWTALLWATFANAVDSIKALLGFETFRGIDAREAQNQTAFMFAVRGGNMETATLLLEKGANLNAKDAHGRNALMHSAIAGNSKMVNWLISQGARLDDTDKDGRTALHHAVLERKSSAVDSLLHAGASHTIKDNINKQTPEQMAMERGDKNLSNSFLQSRYSL